MSLPRSTGAWAGSALALLVALCVLAATPASAAPLLGLGMERTVEPLAPGDERLLYKLTVDNPAGANPSVGDELTCKGTPAEGVPWFGKPTPTFAYAWLRDGEPIGPTTPTYTVTTEDEGKSIQCRVTGTNDPDGAGSAYAPLAATAVSLPPVAVEPVGDPAPPSGSTQPQLNLISAATPSGTASTTAGSAILTDVVTAKGKGDLTAGSEFVTGVTMEASRFARNQIIAGAGIPEETRIETVEETAPGSGVFKVELDKAAEATASGVALGAGAQPFGPGQTISGPGIPAETKVLDVTGFGITGQRIEMSKPASATASGVAISGTAELTCAAPTGWSGDEIEWSFRWLRNGAPIPGAEDDSYVVQPGDTTLNSRLQCEATGEDVAGRKAVAISVQRPTSPPLPRPHVGPSPGSDVPQITFANQTEGEITVQMELPAGEETRAIRVIRDPSWACTKEPPSGAVHGTVECTRSDPLPPQGSYPPIEVPVSIGKNPPAVLTAKARVFGGGAPEPPAVEDTFTMPIGPPLEFGFEAFETRVLDELEDPYAEAGGHPYLAGASLALKRHMRSEPSTEAGPFAVNGMTREIRTEVPPGFVGNPQAIPALCSSVPAVLERPTGCPAGSAVGAVREIKTSFGEFAELPVYAMKPEAGTPAEFAFGIADVGLAFVLTPELRPQDGYAITLVAAPLPKFPELFSTAVDLCGFGVKLTTSTSGESKFAGCRKAGEPGALEKPFLSLPTKCGDPASATTTILADTWEAPGKYAKAQFTLQTPEGCEELAFEPTLKARPTTNRTDSPSGLEADLHLPQSEDPEGHATAHLKKAVLTLPEGLVVNPSAANGLGACSEAQLGMSGGVPDAEPVRCPDNSKIGSVSVTTPILDHPLPGALYVAMPHENPFGSLLALYLAIDSPKDGLRIKLAGEAEANQATGQLTTTFDQNPQAPVEDVTLKLRSGAGAPLRTPSACGKYQPISSLTPWSAPHSGPPAAPKDSWQLNRGPTGGACPATPPNSPSFEAGSGSAIAAAHAPFVVELRREDGTQRFSALTVSPPPGLLAKLVGTTRCSDAALAQAEAKSGREEQGSPSCPPGSELGSVSAAAGAGPAPFHAPGKAYLAGPYKGAPLSVAILTPAVAGPFDLGTVLVRAAAYVDPVTAQVTVKSDPLPQILEGIPLDVRSAAVSIDRPGFILNPTSCKQMAVAGDLLSTLSQSAPLSSRFQLGECGRLPFKPKLRLRLKGKTRRGAYQGLKATLTAKPGEANIAAASVTMPRSAFVAQEHIRTVCTRVQFASDSCPKGSIYGKARAITPLLDEPLEGPVYLRSSENTLPDLVVALKGPASLPVEVELAGRTDSTKGALRNTFEIVPDAPVSKFTLELFGGAKGLIVNSRNLCAGLQKATVKMSAHSGKSRSFRPVVQTGCAKGRRGEKSGR